MRPLAALAIVLGGGAVRGEDAASGVGEEVVVPTLGTLGEGGDAADHIRHSAREGTPFVGGRVGGAARGGPAGRAPRAAAVGIAAEVRDASPWLRAAVEPQRAQLRA